MVIGFYTHVGINVNGFDCNTQGSIAVNNLFEFSIKVKFFRTTAREVKDKFF